jgi:hypothetical protein
MKTILYLFFKILLGKTININTKDRVMNMVVAQITVEMFYSERPQEVTIRLVEKSYRRIK